MKLKIDSDKNKVFMKIDSNFTIIIMLVGLVQGHFVTENESKNK
jgi:hypothetical protein